MDMDKQSKTNVFRVNTFVTKSMYLSYLPCVRKLDLPHSASCSVSRNVNDGECLPLGSVCKGYTYLFRSLESCLHQQNTLNNRDFPFTIRNELSRIGCEEIGATPFSDSSMRQI